MGGRGQSSIRTRQTGHWAQNSGLGGRIPPTLRDALGTKGRPNSISESAVETNPHFSRNYREFSENCQRCVVAYELNRRGYDVTALPTYSGDTLPRVAYFNPATGTYEGRWKGAFRGARTLNVGGRTADAALENIRSRMRSFGNGSRGVVQVFYKGGGGHVFNVENQNGRIVWVEAQTGVLKDVNRAFASVNPATVNLVRTDNLRISDRARNFVTQR